MVTGLVFTCLLMYVIGYCLSPYWLTRKVTQQLEHNNLAYTKTLVPHRLLAPYGHAALATLPAHVTPWQGAGQRYLSQVWPVIAQQQDLHKLLLLYINSTPPERIKRGYRTFPATFRLYDANNLWWLEWQRQSALSWQLSAVCLYNPQPVAEPNSCASSSR